MNQACLLCRSWKSVWCVSVCGCTDSSDICNGYSNFYFTFNFFGFHDHIEHCLQHKTQRLLSRVHKIWTCVWAQGFMCLIIHSLCAGSYIERPAWWRFGWHPHHLYTWQCKLQHLSSSHSWSLVSSPLTSGSADAPLYKKTWKNTHTQTNGKLSIHYTLINRMSSGHRSLSDI